MKHKFFILLFMVFCPLAVMAQPGGRIKLTQLEQAPQIDGSRIGMIGLSNAAGDQRYAFYVNVGDTCIDYTPAATGNSVVSIFVQKCATDSIWYIDWEGRSILLAPNGGAGGSDMDWLEIADDNIPDNINDSIYTYKYASVGARLVWPAATFFVNDSTKAALAVIQGDRNARLALYDGTNENWSMLDHGGYAPTFYMPEGADFNIRTGSGTPQSPISEVNHLGVNSSDSTIQLFQYPKTRVDTNTVVNMLHTDALGKVRSANFASALNGSGGIYGGSGPVPIGTIATAANGFSINSGLSGSLLFGDYAAAGDGSHVSISSGGAQMGNANYYFLAYPQDLHVDMVSPGVNMAFASGNSPSANSGIILNATASINRFTITDNRANKFGIEYSNVGTGADFTDSTLIHRAFAAQMISDSLAGGFGTISTEHLIGQNLLPTIQVESAAGTGASAAIVSAQSSDLAGRFSVTTGTAPTSGLWATITFDDAFSITPIVQLMPEDADAAGIGIGWYVNVSTTSVEIFLTGTPVTATTYELSYIIIGGK